MKFEVAAQDEIFAFGSAQDERQAFRLDTAIQLINGATYEGDYEITPSAEVQIVPAAGLVMRQDLIINPIPSNYGLVTWNGSTLTIT